MVKLIGTTKTNVTSLKLQLQNPTYFEIKNIFRVDKTRFTVEAKHLHYEGAFCCIRLRKTLASLSGNVLRRSPTKIKTP